MNSEKLNCEYLTSQVMIVTLKSWRFISALSVLSILIATVILMANLNNITLYAVLLFTALFCQYYCWRLWLDCHYFQILNLYPEKSAEFDQALSLIFNKSPKSQTMNTRFYGAVRLLKRATVSLILQWGVFFLFLLATS
ncbi:hypothetical protein [Xenorhabdus hominickii]|uniref:Uncharacterized protein n=1 Tax=Xenorhabdus hominickii TaxID=351679 RepID=A0A2G0Q327_XENHO|nr:hypothetical protein [Xenorhabdus hominickii]AOM39849.1 hypothetical protein A9255_04220 [Xenorhabdus hominickii]PHM53634.1 hypothetical protein Xhom_03633 [Xenorhabdus hominickii]